MVWRRGGVWTLTSRCLYTTSPLAGEAPNDVRPSGKLLHFHLRVCVPQYGKSSPLRSAWPRAPEPSGSGSARMTRSEDAHRWPLLESLILHSENPPIHVPSWSFLLQSVFSIPVCFLELGSFYKKKKKRPVNTYIVYFIIIIMRIFIELQNMCIIWHNSRTTGGSKF